MQVPPNYGDTKGLFDYCGCVTVYGIEATRGKQTVISAPVYVWQDIQVVIKESTRVRSA